MERVWSECGASGERVGSEWNEWSGRSEWSEWRVGSEWGASGASGTDGLAPPNADTLEEIISRFGKADQPDDPSSSSRMPPRPSYLASWYVPGLSRAQGKALGAVVIANLRKSLGDVAGDEFHAQRSFMMLPAWPILSNLRCLGFQAN